MRKCFRRFVEAGPLADREKLVVLDVGAADVNGSFRSLCASSRFHYLAADLAAGPNVSVVLEDPYKLPLDDRSVDIVLSGQMLEHCEFFWMSFAEMVRVLKPGGYIFLIAPSAGPIHRWPVDCYRFYPDAYRALAKYANCRLVDVWQDERGPWKDLVGVFAHHEIPPAERIPVPDVASIEAPQFECAPGSPAEEAVKGEPRQAVLADIHRLLQPRSYLEIGVRHGESLALARCPSIGVDPAPEITVALDPSIKVVTATSDDFFEGAAKDLVTQPPDLVLIDGMHLFEYALRDFMNVERLAAPHTLVVVDDVLPNHPAQAERRRRTRVWTGDVWRLHATLQKHRPDLWLQVLDVAPAGLLLIGGLNPANTVLWDNYNPIVRGFEGEPPAEIIERQDVAAPTQELLKPILALLAAARTDPPKPQRLAKLLAKAAAGSGAEA